DGWVVANAAVDRDEIRVEVRQVDLPRRCQREEDRTTAKERFVVADDRGLGQQCAHGRNKPSLPPGPPQKWGQRGRDIKAVRDGVSLAARVLRHRSPACHNGQVSLDSSGNLRQSKLITPAWGPSRLVFAGGSRRSFRPG